MAKEGETIPIGQRVLLLAFSFFLICREWLLMMAGAIGKETASLG